MKVFALLRYTALERSPVLLFSTLDKAEQGAEDFVVQHAEEPEHYIWKSDGGTRIYDSGNGIAHPDYDIWCEIEEGIIDEDD